MDPMAPLSALDALRLIGCLDLGQSWQKIEVTLTGDCFQ